jgi:hypothetical protein
MQPVGASIAKILDREIITGTIRGEITGVTIIIITVEIISLKKDINPGN